MSATSRPNSRHRKLKYLIEPESNYSKLCDAHYLEQLGKQLQHDYEKQQEVREEELARNELQRERERMLQDILDLTSVQSLPPETNLTHTRTLQGDTPKRKSTKSRLSKYSRYFKPKSPYQEAILSKTTFPSIWMNTTHNGHDLAEQTTEEGKEKDMDHV